MLTFTSLLMICSVIIIVAWCWLHWKHRRLIRAANKMKGLLPIRFPILGHIPYTIFGLERLTNWGFQSGVELLRRGEDSAVFWIGPFPIPIICGVENVQKALTSSCTSEKGDEMRFFSVFCGNGLLIDSGDSWKIRRRHINPLFHPNNLEHMMPTFNRNSEELVNILSKHVGKGQFDVMDHVMDTSLKNSCHLIFGPDVAFDIASQGFQDLKRFVKRMPELFIKRVTQAWLRSDIIFNFLYKKELNEINKMWKEFSETPLKIAKARYKEKMKYITQDSAGDSTNNINASNSEGLLNLLDVYGVLQKKFPQFTETDLKNDMVTLYAAGTDTTGAALSSCLLLLAYHQDIQERLYKEIISVVSTDEEVTIANLQNLTYLDQVYKETLRWSTVIPFVARKTTDDLNLSNVTIPAGYTVIVAIVGNSLDPNIFPDPFIFDPERFSSKNSSERERYTFLPFSGGPRTCIGQTYTNMLMKVVLVHILRRYKLSTTMDVNNLRKKLVVTMISAEGYKLSLENR